MVKEHTLKEQSIAVTNWDVDERGDVNPLWTTLPKASKACKELKIASAKICTHMTLELIKPTPYHALSFADVTVFARTDITSSMMRFVERGHNETCFSFGCTYINRSIYILGTFLLAMYAFCDILYAVFQPFSLPTYNFYRFFCETNFL